MFNRLQTHPFSSDYNADKLIIIQKCICIDNSTCDAVLINAVCVCLSDCIDGCMKVKL